MKAAPEGSPSNSQKSRWRMAVFGIIDAQHVLMIFIAPSATRVCQAKIECSAAKMNVPHARMPSRPACDERCQRALASPRLGRNVARACLQRKAPLRPWPHRRKAAALSAAMRQGNRDIANIA